MEFNKRKDQARVCAPGGYFSEIFAPWLKIALKYGVYLINIWHMLNLGTDNLAVKPYIPHQSLFQWICCKCLAWQHGHYYFWPLRLWKLLKSLNIISRPTLWHVRFIPQHQFFLPKKWDQLWLSASISWILEPSPQGLISSIQQDKVKIFTNQSMY